MTAKVLKDHGGRRRPRFEDPSFGFAILSPPRRGAHFGAAEFLSAKFLSAKFLDFGRRVPYSAPLASAMRCAALAGE
ncbi:hypothetical protein [Methylosinus sp. Ce-a6]|uniref:hypothetical protein n=1 Tax=Methylosinus sp. Ce-a6 TaxID=2172005 RepID=UPI001359ACF8|nr:hypothetical protein [Methylosinus sp. Ce-a6]